MTTSYALRQGTVHGTQHSDRHINNQDCALTVQYTAQGRTYYLGLVADGCTGIAEFSCTEVGANLIVLYCMSQIQELTSSGVPVTEIPRVMYPKLARFLNRLAADIFPSKVMSWPYPFEFEDDQEFRNTVSAAERFKIDYLAATIMGYVDDGETLVTFWAGDGVKIVNGQPHIISQNDRPSYVVLYPGGKFETKVYPSAAIQRLALATDGLRNLLMPGLKLDIPTLLFTNQKGDDLGLRNLLLDLRDDYGDRMGDDCGVVTRERLEG